MNKVLSVFFALFRIYLISGCASISAQKIDVGKLDAALGEEVILIPLAVHGGTVKLETTVFHPKDSGMHPLVIINHGANGRLPSFHDQERFRPEALAGFFLDRGYLVAVPMREGFARSTGECKFNCDHAEYALTYERDIEGVITYFVSHGAADPKEVLVIGQSNGGMVTLGYASSAPVAKAIINISGGIDTYGSWCDWKAGMMKAAAVLGATSHIRSLWMYAKDDPIFPPSVSKPFFEAYEAAGGKAQLTLFSGGGHGFALEQGSEHVWGKTVSDFLERTGLPFEVVKK